MRCHDEHQLYLRNTTEYLPLPLLLLLLLLLFIQG